MEINFEECDSLIQFYLTENEDLAHKMMFNKHYNAKEIVYVLSTFFICLSIFAKNKRKHKENYYSFAYESFCYLTDGEIRKRMDKALISQDENELKVLFEECSKATHASEYKLYFKIHTLFSTGIFDYIDDVTHKYDINLMSKGVREFVAREIEIEYSDFNRAPKFKNIMDIIKRKSYYYANKRSRLNKNK